MADPSMKAVCLFICSRAASFLKTRDIAIVENIRLVRLLDLTADFELKKKRKLREKRKTGIQSSLTVTLTSFFWRKFHDVYSLIYNFSDITVVLLTLLLLSLLFVLLLSVAGPTN